MSCVPFATPKLCGPGSWYAALYECVVAASVPEAHPLIPITPAGIITMVHADGTRTPAASTIASPPATQQDQGIQTLQNIGQRRVPSNWTHGQQCLLGSLRLVSTKPCLFRPSTDSTRGRATSSAGGQLSSCQGCRLQMAPVAVQHGFIVLLEYTENTSHAEYPVLGRRQLEV